mmetsp:Transcript_35785/g.114624  ORF Transcript_35785/g.114624 Transcript_35785/m.114624 type:complete len:335 (-) Transcript_35785:998-2002(-)
MVARDGHLFFSVGKEGHPGGAGGDAEESGAVHAESDADVEGDDRRDGGDLDKKGDAPWPEERRGVGDVRGQDLDPGNGRGREAQSPRRQNVAPKDVGGKGVPEIGVDGGEVGVGGPSRSAELRQAGVEVDPRELGPPQKRPRRRLLPDLRGGRAGQEEQLDQHVPIEDVRRRDEAERRRRVQPEGQRDSTKPPPKRRRRRRRRRRRPRQHQLRAAQEPLPRKAPRPGVGHHHPKQQAASGLLAPGIHRQDPRVAEEALQDTQPIDDRRGHHTRHSNSKPHQPPLRREHDSHNQQADPLGRAEGGREAPPRQKRWMDGWMREDSGVQQKNSPAHR